VSARTKRKKLERGSKSGEEREGKEKTNGKERSVHGKK